MEKKKTYLSRFETTGNNMWLPKTNVKNYLCHVQYNRISRVASFFYQIEIHFVQENSFSCKAPEKGKKFFALVCLFSALFSLFLRCIQNISTIVCFICKSIQINMISVYKLCATSRFENSDIVSMVYRARFLSVSFFCHIFKQQ